jgi:two-component system cell cycle response regulator DivK
MFKNEGEPGMTSNDAAILYVEDSTDNRILVRRVLEAEGYLFLEAGSAQQGLEVARSRRPDLILVDINLPEVDGLTLTSHLKTDPDFEHIPIIALTANVMHGDRERSLAAGCDGYIQKPIDVDLLPSQIERFLQNRSQEVV